jgi:hypothetical protein
MLNEVGDRIADRSANCSSASVTLAGCDPRQESLNRCFVREINGFLKGTSLNATLFQRRPSPSADNRGKERPGWLARRSIRLGNRGHGRSQWQTPQQGKDQQDDQDQANQPASRAENGIPAPEAVATAQE